MPASFSSGLRWSYWELRSLRNLAASGLRASDIADRLGRSEGAIRRRASQSRIQLSD